MVHKKTMIQIHTLNTQKEKAKAKLTKKLYWTTVENPNWERNFIEQIQNYQPPNYLLNYFKKKKKKRKKQM